MSEIFSRDEMNAKSHGGSEMMVEGMLARLNPEYHDKFQIISSRVRELYDDRIRILWLHNTAQDPESQQLKDPNFRNKFHKIVYCGNYQMNQYQNFLGIPHDQKTCVIDTAIEPLGTINKGDAKEEIRLIYASTPQRGLSLLVPVFEELCKHHDNLVLDVFSSYKIYGWAEADQQFEELFDRCRNHPKINYHGFQPNDVVREHMAKAHIFAYPSIWPEQNSRSLIEAMSAGCVCIHPNYAGLTDTSGGITMQYNWDQDQNVHANMFYAILNDTINRMKETDMYPYLQFQKTFSDYRYSWSRIANQWNALCASLVYEYEGKDLKVPAAQFSYRTS